MVPVPVKEVVSGVEMMKKEDPGLVVDRMHKLLLEAEGHPDAEIQHAPLMTPNGTVYGHRESVRVEVNHNPLVVSYSINIPTINDILPDFLPFRSASVWSSQEGWSMAATGQIDTVKMLPHGSNDPVPQDSKQAVDAANAAVKNLMAVLHA